MIASSLRDRMLQLHLRLQLHLHHAEVLEGDHPTVQLAAIAVGGELDGIAAVAGRE